ncbi:MAG: thiamine phosphate synthase, partial [Candidatus Angelobacter sp.]
RALWMQASDRAPLIAVSAHTPAELRTAAADGANFAVLAPIFEKAHADVQGIGLDALRDACVGATTPDNIEPAPQNRFAVLALGGVTLANARACLAAGAAGVAAIRLFQNGNIVETVRRLRELEPI